MEAQQLISQLQREAKAHPAKATLLVAMCGVLVYVCVPLFVKSDSDKAKPTAAKTTDINQKLSQQPAPLTAAKDLPSATDSIKNSNWQKIANEIDADPSMKPAAELGNDRDPFAPPPEPVLAEKKLEPKPNRTAPPVPEKIHFTPSEAGLTLSSTLLGSTSRIALINGKPYHVYDAQRTDNRRSVVPFANELDKNGSSKDNPNNNRNDYFVLVDVQARSIILWRLGRRYELDLPGVTLSNGSTFQTLIEKPNPELPRSALTP